MMGNLKNDTPTNKFHFMCVYLPKTYLGFNLMGCLIRNHYVTSPFCYVYVIKNKTKSDKERERESIHQVHIEPITC